MLVDDKPGTTRDSIDTVLRRGEQTFATDNLEAGKLIGAWAMASRKNQSSSSLARVVSKYSDSL